MSWSSVRITVLSMLVVAPLRVFAAFFAILLNSPRLPFATLFRTAYFLSVDTTTGADASRAGWEFSDCERGEDYVY